jgi:hypothetical protein
MALNFGILQPVDIGGQIMAGEQEAQRNQLAQQQLKTGAMQQEKTQMEMTGFKRRQAGLDKFLELSAANGKTGTPEELADSFYNFSLTQGDPTLIMSAYNARQAAKERSAYQASRTPGALAAPAIAPTPELPGVTVGGPNPPTVFGAAPMPTANRLAPAPVAPAASANRLGIDTNALQNQIDKLRIKFPNVPQAQKEADRLEKQLDRLNTTAPDAMLMQQLGYPLTPAGYQAFQEAQRTERPDRLLTPAEEAQKVRLAVAGRAPAQPRAEQPPVAVVDPVSGKQVFVTREEALRGRMTPAVAMENLSPKEIQKREAALPQATSAVKGFEFKSDKFIADLTALRDDPGLDNITGPVFGRTGSVSQAGSRAQATYDKVVAKGGFQALQDLRDASKTGGALGNVSNQEGKQLTASFAAIDRRQNADDVRAAINQAIADIQGTKTRMREAYDSTYAYKSGGESQPSKPVSAAPNIDALLNKYK